MYLENLVIDALEPRVLGGFWESVVGGERLTDESDIVETRLAIEGGPMLDLCFQQVADPVTEPPRLHVDVSGGARPADEVERLLRLGAQPAGVGLVDPEGDPFRVVEEGAADTGPLAALRLESADPDAAAAFWSWLTGWSNASGSSPRSLRHPSTLGFVLELCPEESPKGATKNRMHLDLRLETGDDPDALAAGIAERGGREVFHPEWGELPWRFFVDPSGNEFCLLPARSEN